MSTIELRDHLVISETGERLGKVTDVLFANDGDTPRWAIVNPGALAAEHYVPLKHAYTTSDGKVVVPYEKTLVKHSPKVTRDHLLSSQMEEYLTRYYDVS